MPRWLQIAGSLALIAVSYGWIGLNVIGNLATAVDLFDWVPKWVRALAAHQELGYQIGPWFLMGLGVVSLLVIHFLPAPATGPQVAQPERPPEPAYPDWSVRQLFVYLAPSLEFAQMDRTHERVGRDVMDKFSLGRLKVWGRAVGNPTLVPIEPSYWRHAGFTFLFLGDDDSSSDVWSTKVKERHKHAELSEYRSIEVNKAEALRVWPKPLEPLISLTEAAIRFYEQMRQAGNFWAYAAERLGAHGLTGESTEEEVLDYLAHFVGKKIALYGIKPPSRLLERIDQEKIRSGIFKRCGGEFWTHYAKSPTFKDLKVNSVELDLLIALEKIKKL